jgi:hypothetical protein
MNSATPLHIFESYFDVELDRSALKHFNDVPYERWVDFAKHYLAFMEDQFAAQFFDTTADDEDQLRLYFEPRMAHDWAAAVEQLYAPTPLLGVRPDPGRDEITREDVSRLLNPLKKHLLLADSIYIRDSFYYCFDMVADSVDREQWPDDPNAKRLVEESVQRLKRWLPILIELRQLIESRAIVFTPYYLTPSFPFEANAPALQAALRQVRARPGRSINPRVNENEVIGAWLNGQLLGLNPVFPNRAMFDMATDLYFSGDESPNELTVDLMSIDILPFGRDKDLGLKELLSLRKNEHTFQEVRGAVMACREFLEAEVGSAATPAGLSASCRDVLRERLADCERRSVLRFVADHPIAGVGIGVSVAVGATLLPLAPVMGAAAAALASPELALRARRKLDPKRRAIGRLQALL